MVQGPGGGGQRDLGTQARGFFGALFDLSFTSFVTARIISVLYLVSIVVIAFYAVVFIVTAFNISSGFGAFTLLILAPLFFLVLTVYVRVLLEVVMVFFRIAENTSEMVRQGRRDGASPPPAPEPGEQ